MPQSLEEKFLDQVDAIRPGDERALQEAADTLFSIRQHTGVISKDVHDACERFALLRNIADGSGVDDVTDGDALVPVGADSADDHSDK